MRESLGLTTPDPGWQSETFAPHELSSHVEIGIPNERAARLMLSNWATTTNIRMLLRSAVR
jgi:hypothetical protein